MITYLLFPILAFLIPGGIGYALGRFRPGGKRWVHGLLSALPVSLSIFGFAGWIVLTQDMSCDPAPCNNMAPMWAAALAVIGVVALLTGMGMGMIGDAVARGQVTKGSEPFK